MMQGAVRQLVLLAGLLALVAGATQGLASDKPTTTTEASADDDAITLTGEACTNLTRIKSEYESSYQTLNSSLSTILTDANQTKDVKAFLDQITIIQNDIANCTIKPKELIVNIWTVLCKELAVQLQLVYLARDDPSNQTLRAQINTTLDDLDKFNQTQSSLFELLQSEAASLINDVPYGEDSTVVEEVKKLILLTQVVSESIRYVQTTEWLQEVADALEELMPHLQIPPTPS